MAINVKQPLATHLIVEEHECLQAQNYSNGVVFPIKNMTVGRKHPEGTSSYYQLSDLSNTHSLALYIRNRTEIQDVELPQDMLRRIAAYIRQKHIVTSPFDCSSFAHYANGIPYTYPIFYPEEWSISQLSAPDSLQVGNTIFLSESENPRNYRVTHFAIYIGRLLFISKFGSSGPLIATGLPEMQQCFGGEHVFQAQPANPSTVSD